MLDELEAKKDKIEQKNAGFSKIIDEVFFLKYIIYLFIYKSTIRFFYYRKKTFSRKKKAL